MSESSVHSALRSSARLVVVEAPAGCGKTYLGAQYTREVGEQLDRGKLLILTHTHAAREVFHSRTNGCRSKAEIRTIDSLLAEIASAYHEPLGFPKDVGSWALQQNKFGEVAEKVSLLLERAPSVAEAISARYPIIVCDEHQDASAPQESIILACLRAGSALRIFGDPRQRIYSRGPTALKDVQRWNDLKQSADRYETLDTPHRWRNGHEALGRWIQERRLALWEDGFIDLRSPLPSDVKVLMAENQSARFGGYRVSPEEGKPIWKLVRSSQSLLVLSAFNSTVSALRGMFSRDLHLWEGHVRDHLQDLVVAIENGETSPQQIAGAAVTFMQKVATGFTDSAFANTLLSEVRTGCSGKRAGKPAKLQALARILLEKPNHQGVALFLRSLNQLQKTEKTFAAIRLDGRREFWEAANLGDFDGATEGMAELARRRASTSHAMPLKSLSTIHKAKGLECSNVLIMPCDGVHFKDSEENRCALYVAMSRGAKSLTFVVSQTNRSPLILI